MIKKLSALILVLMVGIFIITPKASAAGEFSSNYKVNYDVDISGDTQVSEQVNLTNLTDNFYASSFSLTIGATQISDVAATDSSGFNLDASVAREGTKTQIVVTFNSQVAGKGKVNSFTLKFKSKDFAQNQGKIWQVSVPKIATTDGVSGYNLSLSVPLEFGDPSSILPEPSSQSEEGNRIILNYTKDQLSESGILATFGLNQLLDFNLIFHLSNQGILPTVARVPLPSDSDFQEIQLDNIDPKPDTVTTDEDGNNIAWFRVNRHTNLDVKVNGVAKLYISNRNKLPGLLPKELEQKYLSPQKYWESDNPLITAKLSDIFKNGKPQSVRDQARLINNFVANTLNFDSTRLDSRDFSRFGALTVLNNPNTALDNEFSDLFIALARADGIPARELDGYAYSSNPDIRPLTLGGTTLHSWAEYYDPDSGWIMIDPAWQNTTGGVDYFSRFDLNHLVLAIKGVSSTDPNTTGALSVGFSNAGFNPHPNLVLSLDSPSEIFSGFPARLKVDVINNGSTALPSSVLSLSASQIQIPEIKSFSTPKIPPFGRLSYSFDLRTPSLFSAFDDTVVINIAGQTFNRSVSVRPFFAFKFFPLVVFGVIGLMVIIYSVILGIHIHRYKKHKKAKK